MNAVAALSIAVDLVQALVTLAGESAKVSAIISKRIAEGREVWTPEELKEITDELEKARAEAHNAVNNLP